MLNFPGSGGESKCGGGAREGVDGADAPQEVNLLPDPKSRLREAVSKLGIASLCLIISGKGNF